MVIFFYSGIFGNVIQILQISIKLKEPRKGMLITEAMDEGEASKIQRKVGIPSLSAIHQTSDGLTTRSKFEPYLKGSCIICQVPGGSVRKVEFEATRKHMFEMSKKLQDKGLFFRLNEITKTENAVKKSNKKMKASAILYQELKYCIVCIFFDLAKAQLYKSQSN